MNINDAFPSRYVKAAQLFPTVVSGADVISDDAADALADFLDVISDDAADALADFLDVISDDAADALADFLLDRWSAMQTRSTESAT